MLCASSQIYGLKAFKKDLAERKQEAEQDEWIRIAERLDAKEEKKKK